MPLDFRYHLASLAAVFGALILGMLLGVAMKEGPALSNQVQELRKEFKRAEVFKDIDQHADKFNVRTQQLVLRNRLQGRNVLLVCNPLQQSDEELNAVKDAIEFSGATVTAVVKIKPALLQLNAQQLEQLQNQMGISSAINKSPAIADIVKIMTRELGSNSTQAIPVLTREKLIRIIGEPTTPFSIVVFLGGATEKEDVLSQVDLPFLRQWEGRATVVATEPFSAPRSVIRQYQKIAPITIDNIDRAAGRIAMILALSTGQRDHYGYKQTANDVAPECDE